MNEPVVNEEVLAHYADVASLREEGMAYSVVAAIAQECLRLRADKARLDFMERRLRSREAFAFDPPVSGEVDLRAAIDAARGAE